MERETATCTCCKCKARFRVLADEYGDHPCPRCGYHPENDEEEEEEEEERGYRIG